MSMGAVKYGTYQTGNSIMIRAKVFRRRPFSGKVQAIRPAGASTLRSVAVNSSLSRPIFPPAQIHPPRNFRGTILVPSLRDRYIQSHRRRILVRPKEIMPCRARWDDFSLSVCLPLSCIGAKLTQLEVFVPAAQGARLSFICRNAITFLQRPLISNSSRRAVAGLMKCFGLVLD
jgi:hypothetical protein